MDEMIQRRKIIFVGDIYIQRKKNIEKKILEYFDNVDYRICNLEGPICDDTVRVSKKVGPNIKQSKEISGFIADFKFDMYNIMNNHVFDYGDSAIKQTIDKIGINHICGVSESKDDLVKEIVIDNYHICILSVAECSFFFESKKYQGLTIDDSRVIDLIKNIKKEGKICILQCHAGAENLCVPLPEIREIYVRYIKAGADVVIGHHPHIIQGYEKIDGKFIYYSLGNFCFDTNELNKSERGLIAEVEVSKEGINVNTYCVEHNRDELFFCGIEQFEEATRLLNIKKKYDELICDYITNYYKNNYARYLLYEIGIDINSRKSICWFALRALFKKRVTIDKNWFIHNNAVHTNKFIVSNIIKELIMVKKQ